MTPEDDLDRMVDAVLAMLSQRWPGTEFHVGMDLLDLEVVWVRHDASPTEEDVLEAVSTAMGTFGTPPRGFVTAAAREYPPLLAEGVAVVRSWLAGDLELATGPSPLYGLATDRDKFDARTVALADVDTQERDLAEALIAHTGVTAVSHLGYLASGARMSLRLLLGTTMLECGEAFVDAMTPVPA
jgi:hypothetical protein